MDVSFILITVAALAVTGCIAAVILSVMPKERGGIYLFATICAFGLPSQDSPATLGAFADLCV